VYLSSLFAGYIQSQMKIILKPIGTVDKHLVEELKNKLQGMFGCPMEIGDSMDVPVQACNRERSQFLAPEILDRLEQNKLDQKYWMLGIIDVDLYTTELKNYVFGQAAPAKGVALISLYRLRQELPPDPVLFSSRILKEAVHEIGHIFGLEHCSNIKCVMHFSNSLHDTDIKKPSFCSQCQPKLIQ